MMDNSDNNLVDWLITLKNNSARIRFKTGLKHWADEYYEIQKVEKCSMGTEVYNVVSFRSAKHQALSIVDLRNIREILLERPIEVSGREINKIIVDSPDGSVRLDRTIL